MKRTLTFLMLVLCVPIFAQTPDNLVTNITITLPANPDPNVANWTTGAPVFMISAKGMTDSRGELLERVRSSKILVAIEGNAGCLSHTPLSAPASLFSKLPPPWVGIKAIDLLKEKCVLKPGDYNLCVTFYDLKGIKISDKICKSFTIRPQETINYQPPQAIAPADGTVISEADLKKPVTFRWTPVTPKPKDEVIYKLRVFEVKSGQTASGVAKNAPALLQKEIRNQTQFIVPSLAQLPITKGSSYGWYVQAVLPNGTPVGGNNGMSGVMVLKIIIDDSTPGCFEIDSTLYKVECNGIDINGHPKYKLTNLILKNVGTNPGKTGLHTGPITDYIIPTGFTISNLNPLSATNILPNNSINISFEISNANNPISFVVYSTIPHPTNPLAFCDEAIVITVDLPPCICNDCDTVNIDFVNKSATKVNNNTYNLTGTLDVNIPFYGAEFQVLSWEYTATPPACTNGVNALEQSAMLLLPSTTVNGNVPVACDVSIPGNNANAVKCVRYLTTTPINDPPFNLTIGLPGALPGLPPNCCAINYRVCIKATIFLDDKHCNYCSYIECFEFNNQ